MEQAEPIKSIKQKEQLHSYKQWKIAKSSLGRRFILYQYFLNITNKKNGKLG